jgi:hypothetical protein
VKYIGYLAFPLQMTTSYPALAQFLAGRWATQAVHIVPVFGEKGALLEHWVFDLFFNLPRAFAKWARPRVGLLLSFWALLGVGLTTCIFRWFDLPLGGPRALLYPLVTRYRYKETTP